MRRGDSPLEFKSLRMTMNCASRHRLSTMLSANLKYRPRVQLWMLRLMIAILLSGLPGALLPEIAFQKFAWLMGYGKQPITPLVVYLSGNAGFAYVVIAALIWVISRDLERYQPLVRMCGWVMVIAGPAYLSIDLQCPLPLWWTLMDSVGCLLIGIVLLWACPRESAVTKKDL